MRAMIAVILFLAVLGGASAGELSKGDNELVFEFSYADSDFGSSGGFDLGSTEEIELSLSYGWMLTDSHEVGLVVGYFDEEIDSGDFNTDEETDGLLRA